MEKVSRGEDPLGTIRDPARNAEPIHIRSEADLGGGWRGFRGNGMQQQEMTASIPAS